MGFYEELGVYATVAIIPTLLLLPGHVHDDRILYPLIGVLAAILIPIVYDMTKQKRKRSKISGFQSRYLDLIAAVPMDQEEYAKNVPKEITSDLANLGPYIQDAYDADRYVEFARSVNRLGQLNDKGVPLPDLYDLTLETARNLQGRY